MIHLHQRPAAIAFTGGIDSTVLAYWLCAENDKLELEFSPTPEPPGYKTKLTLLCCNYGQKTWNRTLDLANEHAMILSHKYPKLHVEAQPIRVVLPDWTTGGGLFQENYVPPKQDETVDHHEEVRRYDYCYVDGLNVIMYSWMMAWCSKQEVSYLLTGHQFEVNEWDHFDGYKYRTDDSTPFFTERMNLMNELGFSYRTRIESPFISMRLSKYNICNLGVQLDVDLGKKTFSCQFSPSCQKCDNCIIRRKAFAMLNIKDEYV